MKLLGIDYGSKKIGVAVSDESGRFAFPYSVVPSDVHALGKIVDIFKKEGVEKIVVGESLNFKGEPNPIMRDIKIFANKLSQATGAPVAFEKEFLTTMEASRIQGRHENIDASAAALILKSYIDKKK